MGFFWTVSTLTSFCFVNYILVAASCLDRLNWSSCISIQTNQTVSSYMVDNDANCSCVYNLTCRTKLLIADVERYGPYYLSNSCSDVNLTNGTCNATGCQDVENLYDYLSTRDIYHAGYVLPLKYNFSSVNLSIVRETLSNLLHVPPEQLVVLFANTSTNIAQLNVLNPPGFSPPNEYWIPFKDLRSQLRTNMYSNRTLLNTIRSPPPQYCLNISTTTNRSSMMIDGPATNPNSLSDACKAKIPKEALNRMTSTCMSTACNCFGFSSTPPNSSIQLDSCAVIYGTSSCTTNKNCTSFATQCYKDQLACLNDTVLPVMRITPECSKEYEELRDQDRVFMACITTHCNHEASRLLPEDVIQSICKNVKDSVGSLPPQQTLGPSSSAPPATTTAPPSVTKNPPTPSVTSKVLTTLLPAFGVASDTNLSGDSGQIVTVIGVVLGIVVFVGVVGFAIQILRTQYSTNYGADREDDTAMESLNQSMVVN